MSKNLDWNNTHSPLQLDFFAGVGHKLPRLMTHAVVECHEGEVHILFLLPSYDDALMWIRSDVPNWDNVAEEVDPMKMDEKALCALYTDTEDNPDTTWMRIVELELPVKVIDEEGR